MQQPGTACEGFRCFQLCCLWRQAGSIGALTGWCGNSIRAFWGVENVRACSSLAQPAKVCGALMLGFVLVAASWQHWCMTWDMRAWLVAFLYPPGLTHTRVPSPSPHRVLKVCLPTGFDLKPRQRLCMGCRHMLLVPRPEAFISIRAECRPSVRFGKCTGSCTYTTVNTDGLHTAGMATGQNLLSMEICTFCFLTDCRR